MQHFAPRGRVAAVFPCLIFIGACGSGEPDSLSRGSGGANEPRAGSGGASANTGGNVGNGGTASGGALPGGSSTFSGGTSQGGSPGAGGTQGGDGSGGANRGGGSSGGGSSGGAGSANVDADLERLPGCAGVFNPDQMLDYAITMTAADYTALLADTSFAKSFSAQMSCGGGAPLSVAIERKRSGGATKVGLKVDVNRLVTGQTFHGLEKLGFENGVSSGSNKDDATPRDVIAEYLSWRFMQRAGVIASRAAFVRIRVNDGPFMAYVNVEQVNKRFLKARLGEDEGWLYKMSGGDGDGLKTHEADGLANPYEARFCFWHGQCAAPSTAQLSQSLPMWLDIPQMLAFGATNAFISNPDGMFFKNNNYFHYDSPAGFRTYIPWDLDTTMNGNVHVLNGGVPGGTKKYSDVLFGNWKSEYVAILRRLLDTDLTQPVLDAEITRAANVAGAAIDADPALAGSSAEAVEQLRAWWVSRRQAVASQIP